MLSAFLQYITAKQLFEKDTRLLLTVSGGIDSVVLAHLCFQAGYTFGIAHCNFQLRGNESKIDEEFVANLARLYNVPFYLSRFETKDYAQQNGVSTQMAARNLRYEWFEKIRQENEFDLIVTAHHQDDVLETVLINLTRGTGLGGLHGILPKNGRIVRPLLFATRSLIHSFLREQKLVWREDSSNASIDYIRNRLRHEVLPILKGINPQVSAAVFQLTERIQDIEAIFKESNDEVSSRTLTKQQDTVWIHKQTIEQLSGSLERLHSYLSEFGFSYFQTSQIWSQRYHAVGKQFLSCTHQLTNDRQHWVISALSKFEKKPLYLAEQAGTIPFSNGTIEWKSIPFFSESFPHSNEQVYVNADKLHFPLLLRPWRNGDFFCPLGMKGKRKKVSDFLIDAKIPLNLKASIWVLESNHEIIWIVGYRLDERFRAVKDNERVLVFNYYTSY